MFKEIDLDKSGWISYEIYFMFLKYYFGTLCADDYECKSQPDTVDPDSEWLEGLKKLSALERFIRMIRDQLKEIFLRYDANKNLMFEEDEIEAILYNVFHLNET